jgi:hypothetical protein
MAISALATASLLTKAQTTPFVPSIIPPSPNAASLAKFSDVPVSPYTGTADVSIPIYDIKARGISVPVSLNYHTGGIRVKEEAGWVGLGWALNAGGMISRTIMGLDDFGGDYFNTFVPDVTGNLVNAPVYSSYPLDGAGTMGKYGYDFFCNDSVYTDQGPKNFTNTFANTTVPFDLEADQFSFNFPGHSGKFIISRNGAVVIQKQENLKILYETNGNSFTILDDAGNSFYFVDKDYSKPSTGGAQAISSWLLSRIVTTVRDTVYFNYATDSTWAQTASEQYETYRDGCPEITGMIINTPPPTSYLNKTLQTIKFSNGQVQFTFDNSRTDLQNGKKLNDIAIYSKNAAGSLTYLHEYKFFYSYFNSGQTPALEYQRLRLDSVKQVSGSAAIPPYSFVYNLPPSSFTAKHGFAVDHWGYYNGAGGNSQFTPSYLGLATLAVTPIGAGQLPVVLATEIVNIPGSNREPDPSSMVAFSLQQVSYPTGGATRFDYEPNDYDDIASSQPGTRDFPQLKLVDTLVDPFFLGRGTFNGSTDLTNVYPPAGTATNYTLSVTFRANDSASLAKYRANNGKIYFRFGSTNVDISQSNLYCTGPVCTLANIPLLANPAGVISYTANIDPSVDSTFQGIYVVVAWSESWTTHYKNTTLMASGLRVKNVTDVGADGTIAKMRHYNYEYVADNYGLGVRPYTYGKLMSYPTYGRYESVTVSGGGTCISLSLSSSSISAVSSEIQGNIVGYSTVEEYTVNPFTGQDIGKTVYNYFNSPDTPICYNGWHLPGLLNIPHNLSGSLLSKVVYADVGGNYTKVSESDKFYHTAARLAYWNCKAVYVGGGGGLYTGHCQFGENLANQFMACFYPSIKSERVLLDSTTDIAYDQSDPTKYVSTTHRYYYDNPVHYQVTRVNTSDSKGNTLVTFQKYPQDYIPNGFSVTGNTILDTMIAHNMVTPTIEKVDSLYYPGGGTGNVTGGRLNLYRLLSGSIPISDKQFQLDLPSPVTNFQAFAISGNSTSQDSRYRQMISFDQYDNLGNLQQYTSTDQNPVTILWDYTHDYPIAQVKNAALADVAATSFEADGTGGWTYTGASTPDTTSITGSNCYNLGQTGGSITKSGLTAGTTYVLSYWTKNVSPLSITGTLAGYPITGKTIHGWTYYEYELTGQTTLTLSGTGYIDELRLYPATAQMTTFTYSPLTGTTTTCDVDNKVTYYFYDGYQRLRRIKDQDGNILKTIQYHYANQQPSNQ